MIYGDRPARNIDPARRRILTILAVVWMTVFGMIAAHVPDPTSELVPTSPDTEETAP